MTLIVARRLDKKIWMVGDTAITDPDKQLRDRLNRPKVISSSDRLSVIGYAGAAEVGEESAFQASAVSSGERALDLLKKASSQAEVEFAYATYGTDDGPQLFRISRGQSEARDALYLGQQEAFELFQRIRHGETDPYAPKALKTFMCLAKKAEVPNELKTDVRSFIDLFASRGSRDVGGWAIPYFLSDGKVHFVSYGYGVSDPLFDQLAPGSLIPHGTQQGGGGNLCVVEVGDDNGMVVYWLQIPGGTVLLREAMGYSVHVAKGMPTAFKQAILEQLGIMVDLFIDNQPAGPLERLIISRDAKGNPLMAIAKHGRSIQMAVHDLQNPFQVTIPVGDEPPFPMPSEMAAKKVSDEAVELEIRDQKLLLSGPELSALISALAALRAELKPEVPTELGGSSLAQLDPAWRTHGSPHPALAGAMLNLRHSGYGWLSFLLPPKEAGDLGNWLTHVGAVRNQ